jgi:hypothetical protein
MDALNPLILFAALLLLAFPLAVFLDNAPVPLARSPMNCFVRRLVVKTILRRCLLPEFFGLPAMMFSGGNYALANAGFFLL